MPSSPSPASVPAPSTSRGCDPADAAHRPGATTSRTAHGRANRALLILGGLLAFATGTLWEVHYVDAVIGTDAEWRSVVAVLLLPAAACGVLMLGLSLAGLVALRTGAAQAQTLLVAAVVVTVIGVVTLGPYVGF